MENLSAFLEQITPEIREKLTFPGETFTAIYERLKNQDYTKEDIEKIALIFERLSSLPNQGFIELTGIFEKYVMHDLK